MSNKKKKKKETKTFQTSNFSMLFTVLKEKPELNLICSSASYSEEIGIEQ